MKCGHGREGRRVRSGRSEGEERFEFEVFEWSTCRLESGRRLSSQLWSTWKRLDVGGREVFRS